jgi:hypothetical protein
MKTPDSICIHCEFCIHDPDPRRKPGDVPWYDYRCGAVIHEKTIDPVLGSEIFLTHEMGLPTTDKHPNCRDMNADGNCSLFSEGVCHEKH